MPRLHWFWRGAIAVVLGTATARLLLIPMEVLGREVARRLISGRLIDSGIAYRIEEDVIFFLPGAIMAVVAYGILTVLFRRTACDAETRCRQCSYILRGITEPRCPECGERI
jgi:hypothetical protein